MTTTLLIPQSADEFPRRLDVIFETVSAITIQISNHAIQRNLERSRDSITGQPGVDHFATYCYLLLLGCSHFKQTVYISRNSRTNWFNI